MGAEEITITGTADGRYAEILTTEAVAFIVALDREFGARPRHGRDALSGRVAPAAPDLTDRRVEITGPPERKMTINALNSGAKVWMADFEDATSPTWENVVRSEERR